MVKDKTIITITAIVCITILEGYAIYNKIDGAVLSLVIGAIAGLGGFLIKNMTGKGGKQ